MHRRAFIALLVLVFAATAATYTTVFNFTENPISDGGNWAANGSTTGLDWSDVRATTNFAFGTQSGSGANFTDSIAVLGGSWGPTQTAEATVHIASNSTTGFEEVEVLLRFTISAHFAYGYEINCSVNTSTSPYIQIVRWDQTSGSGHFTLLDARPTGPCVNGDKLKGTISGSTITAWLNGTSIFSVTDSTFTGGTPGIGFYLQGATGIAGDYGHSAFTATDGLTTYSTAFGGPINSGGSATLQ
jgi:hypothetical protein